MVVGSGDPNPLVAGKGIRILREHGIEVTENVLAEECRALNEVFFHYISTRRPYVAMKYAMTMDGHIATRTGASKWITGEEARAHVQTLRHRYRGIMVGVGTVLADDPMLNCRMEGGRDPVRIVCDTGLRTPLTSKLVQTARQQPTVIACSGVEEEKKKPYLEAGCEILNLPTENGHVSLHALMEALGQREIDSVLLEGGAAMNWSALEAGIVNKVYAYIAPKLFGGEDAKTPVGGLGAAVPDQGVRLKNSIIHRIGGDVLIESEVE